MGITPRLAGYRAGGEIRLGLSFRQSAIGDESIQPGVGNLDNERIFARPNQVGDFQDMRCKTRKPCVMSVEVHASYFAHLAQVEENPLPAENQGPVQKKLPAVGSDAGERSGGSVFDFGPTQQRIEHLLRRYTPAERKSDFPGTGNFQRRTVRFNLDRSSLTVAEGKGVDSWRSVEANARVRIVTG